MNSPPTPVADSYSTNEDTPLNVSAPGVLGNDSDPNAGDTLTAVLVSGPANAASFTLNADGSFSYTPGVNFNGGDSFTYKARDNHNADSGNVTVSLTVNPVNDAPSFTPGGNVTVAEDSGPYSAAWATGISAGPPDESGQTLTFHVTNNTNAGLFSIQPAVSSSGTLTYTPAPDANGSATITLTLQDNGGTANGGQDTSAPQTFVINVTPVNDPPSFTKGADQTVLEDAGAQTVVNFATAISAGPNEGSQTVHFNVTGNTKPGLFSAGPLISPTGTLTYTPAANANGTAAITITLQDDGGTANGGVDTSAPQTFNINVTAVNDAPTFTAGPNVIVNEDAGAQTVNNWATNISAGPPDESGQTLSFNVSNNNNALFSAQPAISPTGTLTFTSAPDANGVATVSVALHDNGGTANGGVDASATVQFTITVSAVNDAPVNAVPGAQTVNENGTLTFSNGNGNAISVRDVDANGNAEQVKLTATNGGLTLSTTAGLAFSVGNGTANPTMTFTGTLPNINAALQGMTFVPTNGFTGPASLQIVSNDQGNTGSGGALTDTDMVSITVISGGTLQFSAATYTVAENNGPAVIAITRTGASAGTATVRIDTSNGTATAGSDYTAVSQTVTFNDGETSKTVNIPIIDDLLNEPVETVNLTLSNAAGSGALGSPVTAVLTINDDDPVGGYLKFSAPNYNVNEGGVATVTVQRVGTLTQVVTIDFATGDDSNPPAQLPCAPAPGNTLASSRCDFISAFGRLTWGAGDSSDKTIKVMTTQDNYVEGPETLPLTLSNPAGGAAVLGPGTVLLTINDDVTEPAGNAIDDTGNFVEQLYRDFLNRPSDPAGKAFWVANIDKCNDPAQRPAGMTQAQCVQFFRITTAGAFFLSTEFQTTGGTAYLTNKAAYGGLPTFIRFERDAQEIGQGYVFGTPGGEILLEANKVAYYNDLVIRSEFTSIYGAMSDSQYVNTLVSNTGVFVSAVDRNLLISGLSNQTETRATVLRKISENPQFRTAEFNNMFVLMEYFGFLRRNPDPAGFNFWLNKLIQFNGDFLQAEMVKAFLESNEYRQRFGP